MLRVAVDNSGHRMDVLVRGMTLRAYDWNALQLNQICICEL